MRILLAPPKTHRQLTHKNRCLSPTPTKLEDNAPPTKKINTKKLPINHHQIIKLKPSKRTRRNAIIGHGPGEDQNFTNRRYCLIMLSKNTLSRHVNFQGRIPSWNLCEPVIFYPTFLLGLSGYFLTDFLYRIFHVIMSFSE